MSTRALGALQEARAADYLCAQGLQLVERNYNVKVGEIDLILQDGDTLVFAEVRYRGAGAFVDGLSSVGVTKQQRFIKAVKHYLLMHPKVAQMNMRFDVLSVSERTIEWHRNAFDAGTGW